MAKYSFNKFNAADLTRDAEGQVAVSVGVKSRARILKLPVDLEAPPQFTQVIRGSKAVIPLRELSGEELFQLGVYADSCRTFLSQQESESDVHVLQATSSGRTYWGVYFVERPKPPKRAGG